MPHKPPQFSLRAKPAKQHARRIAAPNRAARDYNLSGAAWRRLREDILRREPLCRACHARGVIARAEHVDHIDEDANNTRPDNLQPLCRRCHSRKTFMAGKGFGRVAAERAARRRASLAASLTRALLDSEPVKPP